jgi:hypothetical protein
MRATSTTVRYGRLGLSAIVAASLGVALAAIGGPPATPVLVSAQASATQFSPVVPRTWDDQAIAELEVPLADPVGSPKHVSADYYYRMPVRPIYKGYAIYSPGHEPPGYKAWLAQQEPELLWGEDRSGTTHAPPLDTEADWIRAGEMVFDAPIDFSTGNNLRLLGESDFYEKTGIALATGGLFPYKQYVIREKGKIELGVLACAMCHTRVMPDGSTIKAAQGNLPVDRMGAYQLRRGTTPIEEERRAYRFFFAAPWLKPDPQARLDTMTREELAALGEAEPPGVCARHRTSPFFPPHVPDLIGVKDRRYLDATGLQPHRSIVDLMRYAALNQGADDLASFAGFIPDGGPGFDTRPDPRERSRYSDEQLYALALYLYSRQPPPNPNPFDARAKRGQDVFRSQGCANCHTPPLYTNNRLVPAPGFTVPPDHLKRYDILSVRVGTDPDLTLKTRRGTGYYKVPSLKGVWYRSMFGHSGWCATLEDWFDPRRLRDDYVPTGFKGAGVTTRAVKGHEFGLKLPPQEKAALIAFLRTL